MNSKFEEFQLIYSYFSKLSYLILFLISLRNWNLNFKANFKLIKYHTYDQFDNISLIISTQYSIYYIVYRLYR